MIAEAHGRTALTRAVPPTIGRCQLTHIERQPIDHGSAAAQHADYEAALRHLGCDILRLPDEPGLPDSVFVEDTAVVLPELAVVARPGAAARRPEIDSVVEYLAEHRELIFIEAPATLDGGDVLVVGRSVWVGASDRTNRAGFDQIRRALERHGYDIRAADVHGCLHLKSAVTALGAEAVIMNPEWTDRAAFAALDSVHVHPAEPFASNVLAFGDAVLMPAGQPATRAAIAARGHRVVEVDVSELMKAEAGVTCCSLIL